MIKTRYEIELEIDDTKFKVTLNEPNAAQKDEMKVLAVESSAVYEKRDALQSSLSEKKEEFEVNKLLVKESGVIDKVKLLLEQKSLNKEIFALKRDIDEIDKNTISINESIETLFAKRFELLIGGPDKTALKKVIEEKGINYRVIFETLSKLALDTKEKK